MRATIRRSNGKAEGGEGSSDESTAKLDYNSLLGYAVAVLGMSKNEFDWLTPVEFQCCINARNEKAQQELQLEYEKERFNAWLVLIPHIKKGIDLHDLIQFPWEKKEIKRGRVINGKTNSISEIKSTIRRGQQEAAGETSAD